MGFLNWLIGKSDKKKNSTQINSANSHSIFSGLNDYGIINHPTVDSRTRLIGNGTGKRDSEEERLLAMLRKNRYQQPSTPLNSKYNPKSVSKENSNVKGKRLFSDGMIKGEIEIDTFFDHIDPAETFIYFNDRLYTLGALNSSNGRYCVNKGNNKYSLENSFSIQYLESQLAERNQERIDIYQKANLDRLTTEFKELGSEFSQVQGELNNSGSEIEDFIQRFIFPLAGNSDALNKSSKTNLKLPDEDFQFRNSKTNLRFGYRTLEETLSFFPAGAFPHGFAIMNGAIYRIPKQLTTDLGCIERVCSLREFTQEYKRRVKKSLDRAIAADFKELLEKVGGRREAVERAKNTPKPAKVNRVGDLRYDKISDSEFIIYREIPDFTAKVNKKFYYICGTRVGVDLVYNSINNRIITSERAFVYKDPLYSYPPINGGSDKETICYGAFNDASQRTALFGFYTNPTKSQLAQNVLNNIGRGIIFLRTGLRGNGYRSIDSCSRDTIRQIEEREKNSFERQGIKFFDNDFTS